MKGKLIKELMLIIIILCAIWIPAIIGKYDYLMALIIMLSTIVGGYFGGKFLKK